MSGWTVFCLIVLAEHLKSQGYDAGVWYQMD